MDAGQIFCEGICPFDNKKRLRLLTAEKRKKSGERSCLNYREILVSLEKK